MSLNPKAPLCLLNTSVAFLALSVACASVEADEFREVLRPLLSTTCQRCHGDEAVHGEIDFRRFDSRDRFLQDPDLTQKVMQAIDSSAMPPDTEPALDESIRLQAVKLLKSLLRESAAASPRSALPVSRLNRFQYNHTLRDLFQLDRDVFPLSEKLMTRHDDYLRRALAASGEDGMSDRVSVASHALHPQGGLRDVKPFPKDLRAQHGFDNQANQLTLSPLLLDAFLKLSVSILESPDFNSQTVGIWNDFFAEPEGVGDPTVRETIVKERLRKFLKIAFRGVVADETLDRYAAYARSQMSQGRTFTAGMKKVAAAALSSPLFLYRVPPSGPDEEQFALASRLSYFLWGSCPDEALLEAAASGELADSQRLGQTIDRMLADPKIERFLDSFPSQWMQLENVLAATPDPQVNRYYALDADRPAGLHMMLEPLLLFDAVFLENRPIVELISPKFSYRSEFLENWYHSDLSAPPIDTKAMEEENRQRDKRRLELGESIANLQKRLEELVAPVREQLLAEQETGGEDAPPVDLKPYAVWEFNGDLRESLRGLDLTPHGQIEFRDGMVVLGQSYLLSKPLPIDVTAKTLEVWFHLYQLDQPGGGLMGLQGPGDFFDTIVIGERKRRHWISGSNGFSRTDDFPDSFEETETQELLHLMMVYREDGSTLLYRNGVPYGRPFNKGRATFPRDRSSVIFGLRHLPAGGNRYLAVMIDQARFYDRALTEQEVQVAAEGRGTFVSVEQLVAALTPEQNRHRKKLLDQIEAQSQQRRQVPANVDIGAAVAANQRRYDDKMREWLRSREFRRVEVKDPRYGGIVTNAAMLSMTSGPKRTHPVARGVWVIEVIFNDPPPPPPNDVPPLNEDEGDQSLTIREQFAKHREVPSCAGCHSKLDPLGFALENFDITGRWRDRYRNGREVDCSGALLNRHRFDDAVGFKQALSSEQHRFARALTEHLLRFGLAQELTPADVEVVDEVLAVSEEDGLRLRSLLRQMLMSQRFRAFP